MHGTEMFFKTNSVLTVGMIWIEQPRVAQTLRHKAYIAGKVRYSTFPADCLIHSSQTGAAPGRTYIAPVFSDISSFAEKLSTPSWDDARCWLCHRFALRVPQVLLILWDCLVQSWFHNRSLSIRIFFVSSVLHCFLNSSSLLVRFYD